MARIPDPRFSHIAALLRSAMTENQWTVMNLNKLLGMEKHSTNVYQWLNGYGAPNITNRKKLAQLLKVSENELKAKDNVELSTTAVQSRKAILTHDPLTFAITTNGQARIKLDVTVPLDTAVTLLKTLLDAGIDFKKEQ